MSDRPDPTARFSDRVANYIRYRPHYPAGVIDVLEDGAGLTGDSVVADIGSGTGISTEIFLDNGNEVFAVEPNAAMRGAAEEQFAGNENFRSVDGSAENTTLPSASVDFVVASQAFHWFDVERARLEFTRILRDEGCVALIWNARRFDSTPFLRGYEALLGRYGTDYAEVRHTTVDEERLRPFFGGDGPKLRTLYNEQRFDYPGLEGRLLSSSYTPSPDHPDYRPMLDALRTLFQENEEHGEVVIEYDTEIYFGPIG